MFITVMGSIDVHYVQAVVQLFEVVSPRAYTGKKSSVLSDGFQYKRSRGCRTTPIATCRAMSLLISSSFVSTGFPSLKTECMFVFLASSRNTLFRTYREKMSKGVGSESALFSFSYMAP